MEENKIIEFREIVKQFGSQIVLKGINLDIYENEFVTLLGPSGCGKTTLLRILGGFLDADEGKVIFDGEEISNKPPYERELNTVFQKYALFPHLSVYENIAFGLKIKKVSKDVIDQKVMKMLRLIGLEGYEDKNTTLLSGGQQQRVAIARALVCDPEIILLDEPLGALDLKLRKSMQLELKEIQQKTQKTFIYVTHDQEECFSISDKVAVMYLGKIVEMGRTEQLFKSPQHPYTKALLESIPVADPIIEKQRMYQPLKGEATTQRRGAGCVFASRCPYASEQCFQEEPMIHEIEPGYSVACHLFRN